MKLKVKPTIVSAVPNYMKIFIKGLKRKFDI